MRSCKRPGNKHFAHSSPQHVALTQASQCLCHILLASVQSSLYAAADVSQLHAVRAATEAYVTAGSDCHTSDGSKLEDRIKMTLAVRVIFIRAARAATASSACLQLPRPPPSHLCCGATCVSGFALGTPTCSHPSPHGDLLTETIASRHRCIWLINVVWAQPESFQLVHIPCTSGCASLAVLHV